MLPPQQSLNAQIQRMGLARLRVGLVDRRFAVLVFLIEYALQVQPCKPDPDGSTARTVGKGNLSFEFPGADLCLLVTVLVIELEADLVEGRVG